MKENAFQLTTDKAKFLKGMSTVRKYKNEGAPENGLKDVPDRVQVRR